MASKPTSSKPSGKARASPQPDMAVGNFRRMEEIGRGSFATVYKASMTKSPNKFVAIKSVDMHKLNKKLKENLYSEIHILKTLHHPHIVALIDCQETSAHIHLIMEFCELGDLSYFIKKRDTLGRHPTTEAMIRNYPNPPPGGLNEVVVRHFLKQLSSALEFLRAKNFIHRDVKPQNLLLDPSPFYYKDAKPESAPYKAHERSLTPIVGVESMPTLKIADFGFARSLPSTSLAETLCGSPLYMAPEILRYEKYDAKADLWSVGTVLYEMIVGKPPFRASNHVELLRKIERGEDRIRFPEECCLSDSMKKLIRGLLKRNPVERMGFRDFFNHTVIKDEIPGLVEEDRPAQIVVQQSSTPERRLSHIEGVTSEDTSSKSVQHRIESGTLSSPATRTKLSESPQSMAGRVERTIPGQISKTSPPHAMAPDTKEKRRSMDVAKRNVGEDSLSTRRPSMMTHATAPGRQELYLQGTTKPNTTSITPSSNTRTRMPQTPSSPASYERQQERERRREARETQDRAAQDVAFERDYVLVDKRNVEVNAFADELAASPRMIRDQPDASRGMMIRRATTQGAPTSTTGAQVTPSRAMQIAAGKRPEQMHGRHGSYERRLRDGQSATSAISKAINAASGRLFNLGFSPPNSLAGRSGASPPSYCPFPAYPAVSGDLLMLKDGSKTPVPLDEDAKAVQVIEDSATRSNVVYGFAEIKFQQLIPAAPSMNHGLGIRPEGNEGAKGADEDVDLNLGATITCAEEALVLYVKALSLLAHSMNIAGAWWARKNRVEAIDVSTSPGGHSRPTPNLIISTRVNNVVQWVRARFNEVLEKAEFVRLKLLEAQRQLPQGHPGHPTPSTSGSTTGSVGGSCENVTVTSGVTAEKLMYDYALDKSRSAAVNELVGDNLPGCEIDYITAIWLLEAILEDDEDERPAPRKRSGSKESSRSKSEGEEIVNGLEAEDRKSVTKLVQSIKQRHAALQKKMQILSRRPSSSHQTPAPLLKSPAIGRRSPPPLPSTPPH